MALINGIDSENYLGMPISDIFIAAGVVNGESKAKEFVVAQFGEIKIVPADLDGSTTVYQIYEKICQRIGQPLNAFAVSDMEC